MKLGKEINLSVIDEYELEQTLTMQRNDPAM